MRLGLAGLVTALALVLPATAGADTPTDCANLQTTLTAATSGEVITLSGVCTGPFTLPSVSITLRAAAPGDGFNGTDPTPGAPILKGTNVGNTTIQGLTFRNGNASQGGAALQIAGGTSAFPQIVGNTFEDNTAPGSGGAVLVATAGAGTTRITGNAFGSSGHGNVTLTGPGGALDLLIQNNPAIVSGNTFVDNTASGDGSGGGGAAVTMNGASSAFTLDNNFFDHNSAIELGTGFTEGGNFLLQPNGSDSIVLSNNTFAEGTVQASFESISGMRHGGGVGILNNSPPDQATVTQIGNKFDENTIGATGAGEPGGGGEWILAARVNSTGDEFTSNHIVDSDGEGGGVGVEGRSTGPSTFIAGEFHAVNLVADGNSIGSGGRGAGIYAGAPDDCTAVDCPSVLELNDSTVAANCVSSGGTGTEPGTNAPGIAGSGLDELTLRNSIVYNAQSSVSCGTPPAEADVAGFATANTAVTFTDLCSGVAGTGAPVTGAGDTCADPLLTHPEFGDFHETASSPTINAGSNALVPPTLTSDLDGQPRIAGGTVDMGADEVQPPPLPLPVPLPAPGVDVKKPVFRLLQHVLRLDRHGRVKIKLRCVEQSRCIGRLSLVTQKAFVARRKAKKLKVGSKRFNIAGGKTGVVTMKVSSRVRRLLKRKHSFRVVATVTGRDSAGNKGKRVRRTLTLKRAKTKHRR